MGKKLEINDRIYGKSVITEPILIDLIESPAMQRLKEINQFGIPPRFYPYPGFSRYEHSLGVMLLLKKLGTDIEEQSAGLIHDVSHTAFSHLVDWVMGNKEKEDYQDNNLQKIIYLSTIPQILEEHGLNQKKVINIDSYTLLEKPTPYLCADRVDYALREFHTWANRPIVSQCIEDLVDYQGQIVFKTKNSAEKFAETYAKCQREHWGGAECVIRYELLARSLKIALERGHINVNDFYNDDEYVINKINQSRDEEVIGTLRLLKREKLNLKENRKNPQFDLRKKFRHIDPHYLEKGELYLLSESDPNYASLLNEQRKINERRIRVDMVD